MVVKSKLSMVVLINLTVLGLTLPDKAYTQEFLCDARQVSNSSLPLLESDCPIGNGMWGKRKPKPDSSYFWIQCGIYSEPLSLIEAKRIYPSITADVWAKPEGDVYRCLVGPYKNFSNAKQDLARVKRLPDYGQAFIRQVSKGSAQKSNTPPTTKEISTKSQPKLDAGSTNQQVVAHERKESMAIRHKIVINGVEYTVPYSLLSNDQFYMEHELPWNRMSYDMAYKTCDQMGMRLASNNEWQSLLKANVMMKDKWPMHLPYWGEEKTGLFYTGKVKSLKGSSLLNVMCVK
ncbi:SPOR domain-containing protein [Vibrio tetraodonis]|uniref:SPOR domain-containing protein n=1 Tax=Vibrio tetraodonis TaxID=2231647 RepID=UPI000E0AF3C9|nr:SPOR domain-containing protein [Vibrio tetraodonis]